MSMSQRILSLRRNQLQRRQAARRSRISAAIARSAARAGVARKSGSHKTRSRDDKLCGSEEVTGFVDSWLRVTTATACPGDRLSHCISQMEP
jgi:hypothetical protein